MSYSWLAAFLITLGCVAILPAGPTVAQGCEEECPEPEPEKERPDAAPTTPTAVRVSTGVTKSLVRIIEGANRSCADKIDLRYRIDCLRIYYGWVAERLPDTGDYLPVKQAMLAAEAKLDAIVRANLDESAPTVQPRDSRTSSDRKMPPVRPVKRERAEAAAIQAAVVVEETELIILRSGGDPARRTKHYTDLAAAVEDNLIILRSA
jgi:hypothetical protein